ncbi:MAG TPA: AmmeMemoRadiSam system radical SAM enzyme [Bacteroidales bacterium]|jgi:pyruvate formate lyase activating enzyme|nr:AmmeMemoRadiSam system radical SAM enzyme [Bacteroidales bacterium]HOS72792.1 AmmeMemoRadiSam system radical SAM enzyme [Bacteroidales bacterium]HQH24872.1 AmmeMemoRadiSam system radical SAM enzyme [Bacteroidales bacterium]HQJ81879.1 AmmeMemoRadiSam system radical SAM enzyme [Bacteroidales bacterium]
MASNEFNRSKREFIRKCLALSAGVVAMPRFPLNAAPEAEVQGTAGRLAMFQEETPRGVMCLLCPNGCILKDGEISRCNNRTVRKSRLYTMAFGNPCAINIDPMEKKPLYHFHPGTRIFSIATAGCNLACLNCQNWSISQTRPDKTRNYDLMPERVVEEALKNNCRSIAYTYSEPTSFYEYMYETSVLAKRAGIKNVAVSNGYVNPEPLKKLCTVLDAANIDLKSFNDSTYMKLTGGKLQPVLDSLLIYRDSGVWLEITCLIVPTWTDKADEIAAMCKWLSEGGFRDTPVHFTRFYPIYKLDQLPPTPVEFLNEAAGIARQEGMKYIYTGNVPGSEQANTICPGCGTRLILRQGFRIVSNDIRKGRCSKCGREIHGVWS